MFIPPFHTNRETLRLLTGITALHPIATPAVLTMELILLSHARAGGDGQFRHTGPAPHWVPVLVQALIDWYNATPIHPLIRAAVFHFELLRIEPFSIANETTAALLHSEMLALCHPALAGINTNHTLTGTDATELINESLHAILAALQKKADRPVAPRPHRRTSAAEQLVSYIRRHPGSKRQELLAGLPALSPRMLDRHLQALRESGQIEYRGSRKTGAYYAL